MNVPIKNDKYTHINGCEYIVLCVANLGSNRIECPVTVVYQGVDNGAIWAKTIDNFNLKMTKVDK